LPANVSPAAIEFITANQVADSSFHAPWAGGGENLAYVAWEWITFPSIHECDRAFSVCSKYVYSEESSKNQKLDPQG
jgi:hypothetical protein